MRFNVEGYLRRAGRGFRASGPDHLVGKCWDCGKDGHLYINTQTGLWKCFSGKCEAAGNIISAVMAIENVPLEEARRIVTEQQIPLLPEFVGELHDRLSAKEKRERVDAPLPKEYIRCWNGKRLLVPSYLRDRKVRREEIIAYRIGFCTEGRYAQRIILPVDSPYGTSFTSRYMGQREPRYLGGEGAGRLLFGWDVLLRENNEPALVVLVEGPFDVLAVHRAELPVLGLMGKKITQPQLKQLRLLDAEFILLLDKDAIAAAVKQAAELRVVKVAELTAGKDPAVSSSRVIRLAVARASTPERASLHLMRARLSSAKRLAG